MESKDIKRMVERRHPRYNEMLAHWDFLEKSYAGGRAWFDGNIFQYVKEGSDEYQNRLVRAYRFNHSREVVDLVNKYLFRADVKRDQDAKDYLKEFWKATTLQGLEIDEFMQTASTKSSATGCPWVIVDNDLDMPDNASKADEEVAKNEGKGVYAYLVRPQDVLDVGYNDRGQLEWLMVREYKRDDDDPVTSTGDVKERFRLWTVTDWFLFEKVGRKWEQVDAGTHGLGAVPAKMIPNSFSDNLYVAEALITDVAYLDRAVANYLSNLDAIFKTRRFHSWLCQLKAYYQAKICTKRLLIWVLSGYLFTMANTDTSQSSSVQTPNRQS